MRIQSILLSAVFLFAAHSSHADVYKLPKTPILGEIDVTYTFLGDKEEKADSDSRYGMTASFTRGTCRLVNGPAGARSLQMDAASKLLNGQMVETTSLLSLDGPMRTVSFKETRYSPQGKTIEESTYRFDDPSWHYPEDIFTRSVIPVVFSSFIEQGRKEGSFHLWVSLESVIRMKIKMTSREVVKTPEGNMIEYKARMTPDVKSFLPIGDFLASLLQPFIPEVQIVLRQGEKDPSSFWFCAEGQFGPPGAPRMRMEASKVNIPGRSLLPGK